MNRTPFMTKTQTITYGQQLSTTNLFPTFQEMPEEHQTPIDTLSVPFTIYEHSLANSLPQSVRWLWEKRLPMAGITLLDGDHNCGKSLLALQIAAVVSSGTSMPDGTPTIQGGVVIITPHTDATTTQLQLLTSLGADLSRIELLTFVQEPIPSPHTSASRPFSLPEDFPRLFQAIERVDARLIILDPFIGLISRERRWTELRLSHLLADLNQRLIERNVACLLVRNCPARGGHARPSLLERSDFFLITAVSRLLLAPDPMQPDRLCLCHALSRHSALSPTLILQIQQLSENLPRIITQGCHQLSARDFIENRPDTLHRRLLFQHLLAIISDTADPIHVSTLYARSPNSSPFQIQRTLNDLIRMGQIERPARGFYTKAPANPAFTPNEATPTSPTPEPNSDAYWEQMAQEALTDVKAWHKDRADNAATSSNLPEVNPLWTHFERLVLAEQAAGTLILEPTDVLNEAAATTPPPEPTNILNEIVATTPPPEPTNILNEVAATTSPPEPTNILNEVAATTPPSEPAAPSHQTALTIPPPTNHITSQSLPWIAS